MTDETGTSDDAASDKNASDNDASDNDASDNDVPDDMTVSENETIPDDESLSENEAVSENEAEADAVSENSVSENSVSENSVSEDSISENEYNFGTIDMSMEFSEDNRAAIMSTTEDKKAAMAKAANEAGIAWVNAANVIGSSYLDSYYNYVTGINTIKTTEKSWDWAHAAAGLVETAMIKKGIRSKEGVEQSPINAEQIVRSVYNEDRHDLYGETWYRATNTTVYNRNSLRVGGYKRKNPSGNYLPNEYSRYLQDFTAYVGDSGDLDARPSLDQAKGNLIMTVFDMERWGAPNSSGISGGYEGDYDQIDAELSNAVWVPTSDIESIKNLIMEYGAAGIQICVDTDKNRIRGVATPQGTVPDIRFGNEYKFKFNKDKTNYKANHTVILIGWDDNIDRKNFGDNNDEWPGKSGAFLVKDVTCEGYYWLSYEDVAFKSLEGADFQFALALDFVKNTTNDYNYGYDGTNRFTTFETKKVYGIFKSNHTGMTSSRKVEVLNSVGVGVQDAGKYILTVYSGYDPSAEKQYLNQYEVATTTVDIPYPGFHNIPLPDPILYYKNDVISVCLTRVDGQLFNMLVDGFPDKDGYTKVSGDYRMGEISQISENGVLYNAYTHFGRERVEGYFTVPANGGSVLSGNKVPIPGSSNSYMMLTPRMRLYTSDIRMPQDVDQNMLEIKLKKYVWLYTGNNINPFPRLLINFDATEDGAVEDRAGKPYHQVLVMYNKLNNQNVHYDLTYANHKEAGIAAVIVRGKGDIFSGEISAPFKIEKEAVRIDKCKILGLEPQDYHESEKGKTLNSLYGDIKNNIIVKYYISETKHYITLTEGVDYKLGSIEGENAYGKKLSVMITGIDTFKNTAKPKFKIKKKKEKKPISDATVSVNLKYTDSDGNTTFWNDGELPEVRYTGKKINMEVDSVVEVTDPETGEFVTLEKGVDYDAKIKLKNNKNAGMASIIIKAKKGGRFSGKLTRYFLITPKYITTDATVKFKSTYKYTGKPIKAKPTVTLYGKKMSQGDLYVCYYNNTGSSSGTAKATGIVFGKGRYQGYIGYSTFTIDSSDYRPSSSSRSSSRSSSSR